MVHKSRLLLAVALTAGTTGWLATAAFAAPTTAPSPAVDQDSVAVVGTGTSTVQTLDEQGHANQTKVDAADSQTAENDSTIQESDSNIQEGDSGTKQDGTAADVNVKDGNS